MACAHPFGVDPIYDSEGTLIGARCPACKLVAYKDDTRWTVIRRALRQWWEDLRG